MIFLLKPPFSGIFQPTMFDETISGHWAAGISVLQQFSLPIAAGRSPGSLHIAMLPSHALVQHGVPPTLIVEA